MATRTMINQLIRKYKEKNDEYIFREHIKNMYKSEIDLNFLLRDVRDLYYYVYLEKEDKETKIKTITKMIKKMADDIEII